VVTLAIAITNARSNTRSSPAAQLRRSILIASRRFFMPAS
jgi:hypothetical protein